MIIGSMVIGINVSCYINIYIYIYIYITATTNIDTNDHTLPRRHSCIEWCVKR